MDSENEELRCPHCRSAKVAVTVESMFMVNTGEHYCHSVKAHDSTASVLCLDCRWVGKRAQLVTRDRVA
jgi:hypothetical protein